MYGSPYRGVLTGRNEVFVIGRATRDRLISKDPNSIEIIKPFLEGGKDIKRWRPEPRDKHLIFTRRGVDIDNYPAVKTHLEQFREILEPKPKGWKPTTEMPKWIGRKSGAYKWFEIQDTVNYFEEFDKPKIIYAHFNRRYFFYSSESTMCNDKGYILPTVSKELLPILQSNVLWFIILSVAPQVIGGSR